MHNRILNRRRGFLVVAALAVATLAGHVVTRGTGALPARPGDGDPAIPAGIDFVAPGPAPVSFSGRLDRRAVLAGGDGVVKMELVLAAEERPDRLAARTPTDFVVVLDRSGSMDGVKIEQARTAVRELISQLSGADRFALVTYASGAEMSIPLASATEEARRSWRRVVAQVAPGGGTNMSSGLDLALAVTERRAGRAARLILISDGLANEGDPTPAGLADRARRASAREMVVSTVGVGADFNEFLMSALADAGTGNYYYLEDVEQLARVFAGELGATRATVASAVEVAIDPGDGVRVVDAAGYPLEQVDGKTVFRPGSLFAGQERRIWVTLAVANDAPGPRRLGAFTAAYKDQGVTRVLGFSEQPQVACVAEEEAYLAAFDRDAWARSVAEEDYNRLQQRVAGYVKAGRRGEALKEIGDFRAENERLNLQMRREDVRRKLEELESLQAEVDDAFRGADQAEKQNLLSKSRQAAGLDGRRAGSKHGASSSGKGGR